MTVAIFCLFRKSPLHATIQFTFNKLTLAAASTLFPLEKYLNSPPHSLSQIPPGSLPPPICLQSLLPPSLAFFKKVLPTLSLTKNADSCASCPVWAYRILALSQGCGQRRHAQARPLRGPTSKAQETVLFPYPLAGQHHFPSPWAVSLPKESALFATPGTSYFDLTWQGAIFSRSFLGKNSNKW